ncbi:MAG: SDR family oxidoreductase [Rhodobacteraceae bacterium]|nr:SDR family oxidoreductase [Paracoccaceae bacterium]
MAQRVLITAGASGIGRAMAEAFAASGAQVWITDTDAAALAACPADWRRDQIDASDEAATSDLYARLNADWGGLDALCANAGIAGPTALIEDVALTEFQRCLAVNLEGAFLAAKYGAPMMKRQRSGAIIFTSSTAGLKGFPRRAPYASAKWAIIGLMKTVAMELGPYNIRANAICPGSVEGPRIDGVIEREAASKGVPPETLRKAYEGAYSMRCFVKAEDIAAMALYLASPAAARLSGQAIAVDGHTEIPDPRV